MSLWDFLSKRFFSHLDGEHVQYACHLRSDLLKYYLVNAIKSNKKDKVAEFFSSFSHEILAESGEFVCGNLRSWFVVPYMDEPEKDPEFSVYFSSRWIETLRTTTGNFLSVVLQAAPLPKLLLLERWFHAESQQEIRAQLSLSSKKVDNLLSRLEKSEERLSSLRSAVRDMVLYVQKVSVSNSNSTNSKSHSAGLFESDEEADVKRHKVFF